MITIAVTGCRNGDQSEQYETPVDYAPKMVAPGIISTAHFEGHATINPDGSEIYFVIYTNDHSYSTIAHSKRTLSGKWSPPEIASFSGKYSDGSPALSPDGQKLFFSSNRPLNDSMVANSSNDLWVVERSLNGDWGAPKWLGEKVNSPYFEFSPSVDKDGNLYFCSNKPGGFGDMDIYSSPLSPDGYQDAILLDSAVNSEYHEGNVGVSPDGKLLFLMRQHYPGDLGYDDIHYSIKQNESWTYAKNIGPIINTYSYDFSPKVSPDGSMLFFTSRLNRNYQSAERYSYTSYSQMLNSPLNGLGNIYQINLSELNLAK
ncbi:MAG: hypothetical protein Tsb0034_07660 [Ekhidna sp.]